MSNDKLKDALTTALTKQPLAGGADNAADVELTDADLDDVAGGTKAGDGCTAMCNSFL